VEKRCSIQPWPSCGGFIPNEDFAVSTPNLQRGTSAPAEQALCDFAWLSLRDGIEPQSLATFRNLHALSRRRLDQVLRRYPESVQDSVCRIMRAGHRRRADRR
jgi:hypothetical protein